jgi:hypothetical protein
MPQNNTIHLIGFKVPVYNLAPIIPETFFLTDAQGNILTGENNNRLIYS